MKLVSLHMLNTSCTYNIIKFFFLVPFQVVRYILDRNACLLPAYFVINEVNHFKFVPDKYDLCTQKQFGSCVLKASVDRVSVNTICRYGDRHSADMSAECWLSVGRVLVDMLFQLIDHRSTLGRHLGQYVAIDSRQCIG